MQVHAKCSSNKTVQADVEAIYGKYAPFQFLAYWCAFIVIYCDFPFQLISYVVQLGIKLSLSLGDLFLNRFEVWHFYEDKFGKLSEMSHSDYKLITAANMRPKREKTSKRRKLSLHCTELMEASMESLG